MKKKLFQILATLAVSLAVVIPQYYLAINPDLNLGWEALLGAVVFPTLLGSCIFLLGKERVLLFAFLAYIWSVVEDGPIFLDSVFTWPDVTSGPQHALLEILFHALTLVFLALAVREALKGRPATRSKIVKVSILASVAFVLSYAQNIPMQAIQTITLDSWYVLDLVEHALSFVFLYLAVLAARE